MLSKEFTSLLAKAITNKGKAIARYEQLFVEMSDGKTREILKEMLEREQTHLGSLSVVLRKLSPLDVPIEEGSEPDTALGLLKYLERVTWK